MVKRFLLACLVVCVTAALSCGADFTTDSLKTVQENIANKKAVLVDVRDKDEWIRGHVDGALLLPLTELKDADRLGTLLKDLPKDRVVYTHCVVGYRSRKAADILTKQGYEVRALKPGYIELIQAGFPDAKGK